MTITELHSLYLTFGKVFTDSRQACTGGIYFALKGDRFNGNHFAVKAISDGANYAVVDDPTLKDMENCILVDNVLSALQELANYHRKYLKIPIIAITGTNGKTTTKELTSSVLSQSFRVLATRGNLNNHIGVPLTLLSITKEHQIGIVEMGANHPGEIAMLCSIAEPDYGIITNVGKAHLEGFGSFEGVIKTKGELYHHISLHGKGIFINADNEYLKNIAPSNVAKLSYGIHSEKVDLRAEVASSEYTLTGKFLFPKGWLYIKSKLTGSYNLENMLAAARIGLHFNIDPLLIQKGIENYTPENNRSQIIQKGTNTILLDCYNANPSSMDASIRNFIQMKKDDKIVILGDMLELGESSLIEHQKIIELLETGIFAEVFLVGQNFQLTNAPQHFHRFENTDQLMAVIQKRKWENKFFFVKGSRGIQLEKILTVLE